MSTHPPSPGPVDFESGRSINLIFMKKTVESLIRGALKVLGAEPPEHIEIEVPKDPAHGDFAIPVAMGLARSLRKAPRDIARELISAFEGLPEWDAIEKVEIAGPGFINLTFKAEFLYGSLRDLIEKGPERINIGQGSRVLVEFVSANPTGPLHLGHGRGAAVGAAVANLLAAAGYEVVREYYVNDAGRQVRLLGESVMAKMDDGHPFPEEGYRGEYISDIARELGPKWAGKGAPPTLEEVTDAAYGMMLEEIKGALGRFGVLFDTWQSERELFEQGLVEGALEFLKEKDFVYEEDGALWFRAEKFGDDKNRVVKKSNGDYTYFASDIAYHKKKVDDGYDELINVWGADHHGYIQRVECVLEALGFKREKLTVILVQMVSLMRGGKPVQMSKRAGEFVTLKDVIEEVGADTTKFIFLTRRADSHLEFDIEAAKAASSENPVYYVQYANARINSVFKHAAEQGIGEEAARGADLSLLTEPEETALIKKLLTYPMVFETAANTREPHRITYYLQELAGLFHPYYNRHRFVTGDRALTAARLALSKAVQAVLSDGMGILGLTLPDRM